jgi:predicted TIM-barrel fold metal-dependent hydrolase
MALTTALTTAPSTAPPQSEWQFGRIYTPDDAWLARAAPEPILEPDLPIVDPHHHLWLRGGHTGVLGYGPYAGKSAEILSAWKRSMSELAACPNVVVKLGGIVNRGASFDFHSAAAPPSSETIAEVWRPYIETCIELFGPARCMFESNFPVDKMAIGYAALWNAFKRIVSGASRDEKFSLFAGTAARIYRLGAVA